MNNRTIVYMLPGLAVLIALAAILWPYWYGSHTQQEMELKRVEMVLSGQGEEKIALLGPYQLRIEQDQTIAWGEAAQFHASLNPLADSVIESQGGNFVIEMRMEFAGVKVSPEGMVNQPLTSLAQRNFYWSLEPFEQGEVQGTLWAYLSLVSPGSEPELQFEPVRYAILAKPVKVVAVGLFGLPSGHVRQIGMLGLLVVALIVILMVCVFKIH